jgi:hypothetical protein
MLIAEQRRSMCQRAASEGTSGNLGGTSFVAKILVKARSGECATGARKRLTVRHYLFGIEMLFAATRHKRPGQAARP